MATLHDSGPISRPTLLIHLQQFRGTGHRARMSRLAAVLAGYFHVVLLDGGPPQPRWIHPPDVTSIPLTPLFRDSSGVVRPWQDGLALETALEQRRETLVNVVQTFRPQVLILEFYPFARLNLADEIETLIQAVRASRSDALVLSSVRDIVDTGFSDGVPDDQCSQTAMAARLRTLDGVLIHADQSLLVSADRWQQPDYAALERSAVPVVFTGFIGPEDGAVASPTPAELRRGTVLSMGGGIDGRSLAEAVLAIWPQLMSRPDAGRLQPLCLFTGPYMPRNDHEALVDRCAELYVKCHPFSSKYRHVLHRAALSISRFGYNTCMDLLQAGVPAVVVPAPTVYPNDQTPRAKLFERLGRVTVAAADQPEAILEAVAATLQGPRDFPAWRLDGAERSTAWIVGRLARRDSVEASMPV